MSVRKVSRRSVSKERWVETLVVADSKMVEYHGSHHVESYILTIMNMVGMIFPFFRWVNEANFNLILLLITLKQICNVL